MQALITRGQVAADNIAGLYSGSATLLVVAMVVAWIVVTCDRRAAVRGRTTADYVSGVLGICTVMIALAGAGCLYMLVPEVRLWEILG